MKSKKVLVKSVLKSTENPKIWKSVYYFSIFIDLTTVTFWLGQVEIQFTVVILSQYLPTAPHHSHSWPHMQGQQNTHSRKIDQSVCTYSKDTIYIANSVWVQLLAKTIRWALTMKVVCDNSVGVAKSSYSYYCNLPHHCSCCYEIIIFLV